ncbi:hypothetical protein ANCCEY_10098 [Ancylostoma ceylanicum]|uniref:Uncharacterized protein n=1 Tax=Ancylostoma ceylanicum TaxID=53326 RepID=A0A0D6LFS2_9BILA|nr:hypothetical protein ANCCEY_10098 [Ancylostoma ceylanicum]
MPPKVLPSPILAPVRRDCVPLHTLGRLSSFCTFIAFNPGSKPPPSSGSGSSPPCKAVLSATKGMRDIDEGLDLENTNAHDADDDRSTKASDWSSKDWRDQTGSDGSSGVESPPSDIPTSSSSLYNPPKIYNEFVKTLSRNITKCGKKMFEMLSASEAIEEHAITERPDLETQLKIMQWLTGRSVSVFGVHLSL